MKLRMTTAVNRTKMGLCSLVLAGLVATGAHWAMAATTYTTGKVGTILVGTNGNFLFNLENRPKFCNDVPLGATQGGYDWITVTEYATPDAKRQMLSILTSAKLTGSSVTVRGTNNYTKNEWGCHVEGVELL